MITPLHDTFQPTFIQLTHKHTTKNYTEFFRIFGQPSSQPERSEGLFKRLKRRDGLHEISRSYYTENKMGIHIHQQVRKFP
jgi:hypothetical protein